jgi:hypothetical protein
LLFVVCCLLCFVFFFFVLVSPVEHGADK